MLALYELYQQNRTKNAPEFIYSILYQTDPPMIRGRSANHLQRLINGVNIDNHIPEKAIKLLNNIKEIEPRSSCEGSNNQHPTFFIFRFRKDSREEYVKDFCNKLSKNRKYKCGYELGRQGYYRVGITNKLYYSKENEKKFNQWWLELPNEIIDTLKSITQVKE